MKGRCQNHLPLRKTLPTKAQFSDDGTVPLNVLLLEVVEQVSSVADHLQQAAAGMMVLLWTFTCSGQVVDSLGEQSDLDLRGTGVILAGAVSFDNCGFVFFSAALGITSN